MLLFDDKEFFFVESKFLIPLYIAGEKKENENIGLDFPISTENRLNLSTIAHVIRIIFCILSVWLFFLLLSVHFSFFGGSSFSVSSSVFFPMLHLLFFFFFFFFLLFWNPILLYLCFMYGCVWLCMAM